METVEIVLAGDRRIPFEIAHQPGRGAFFILGVRKSGSSILNQICTALAKINDYHYVDVGGILFQRNVIVRDWINDPAINKLLAEGNVYGGFRAMPVIFSESAVFQGAKKILLVRDPRDALVSEYFSNAYSHSIPKASEEGDEVVQQMSKLRQQALATPIEDSVLKMAAQFNRTMLAYSAVSRNPSTLLLRYEDVILDKRRLIGSVCTHFGWKTNDRQVDVILSWADRVPPAEDKTAFIRKVVPGDHKEKLSPKCIADLNRILEPCMDVFGYSNTDEGVGGAGSVRHS